MPLDCDEKIDSDLVTDYVSPEKDVDGLVIAFHIEMTDSIAMHIWLIVLFRILSPLYKSL